MVGELAHGQRQWVELAMVLAREPHLMLLDEPAAGMTHGGNRAHRRADPRDQPASAMIVVEHDMQFIRMIAERGDRVSPGRAS